VNRPRIVDLVFGERPHAPWRIPLAGAGVAAAYALVLALAANYAESPMAAPTPPPVPTEIAVEVATPVPAVKPPEPPHHAEPAHAPKSSEPESHEPKLPPAAAAKVLTAAEDPNAPADLTGDTFVSGSATAAVGGYSAANGTSTTAVHVDPAHDHSKPVSLASGGDWSCPWPREADQQQIDEQTAVVRVVVASNGSVVSAQIVQDPGFGFGAAAVACARTTRFSPARDPEGKPISASSPPIRVRFTR